MSGARSIVQPRAPTGPGWEAVVNPNAAQLDRLGYPYQTYAHAAYGLWVISAVEVASDPGQASLGPEYHLSISLNGRRCDTAGARWVLAAFDLADAKEDNHVPGGIARNFWRPVADHLSGYECPCVGDEPAIVEDQGDYVWRGVTR